MPLDPAVQETPSRILSLVELMREHGHQPDNTLYTAIIRALSVHASHLPTALVRTLRCYVYTQFLQKLMEEMQERGLNPPTELCNAVIAGSLRHDLLQVHTQTHETSKKNMPTTILGGGYLRAHARWSRSRRSAHVLAPCGALRQDW